MCDKLRSSLKRNFYLRDELNLLDRQIELLKENNYPAEVIRDLEKQRSVVDEAFKQGSYNSTKPETIGQKSYDYFYEHSLDIWDKINKNYPAGADGERMRQYDNRLDMIKKVNDGTYSLDDYKNATYQTVPQISRIPQNSQQTIPQITPIPQNSQQTIQQNSNSQEDEFWTWENAKNYLRTAKQLGYTALNGYSMGYLDELYGLAESGAYGATEAFLKAFKGYKPKESTWDSMKQTYVQGRDEMRGELQQVKDEHPTLANIADATGSALSPSVFTKGKEAGVVTSTFIPRVSSWSYGTVGSAMKNQLKNNIFNSVVGGIGNSEENTLTEYAKNIGKSAVGNFSGSKLSNSLLGRNLQYQGARTINDAITNFLVNDFFDKQK